MAPISDHIFAVGDLVTLPNRTNFFTGQLTIWRIASREGDEFMLVPTASDDPRPRLGTLDNMTLVEAWRGPKLARCNTEATEIELVSSILP